MARDTTIPYRRLLRRGLRVATSEPTTGRAASQFKYAAPVGNNLRIGMVMRAHSDGDEKEVSLAVYPEEAEWLRAELGKWLDSLA